MSDTNDTAAALAAASMAAAAASAPPIPGWPDTVDSSALYTVKLSRAFTIGPTAHTPRMDVMLRGDMLEQYKDYIANVLSTTTA